MKITVTVKPNSRQEGVTELSNGEYRVAVNAPALEGRANDAVIRVVALHWGVRKSAVSIRMGHRGRKKVIEILDARGVGTR